MPAHLSFADPVKMIAEQLIENHHQHLLMHRVRMEYVFSDQEPESKGKRKYGEVKKICNLNAYLVGEPTEPLFENPTFVCCKCKKWSMAEEHAELEVNADIFEFCQPCFDEVCEWDFSTNTNIAKLVGWRDMAKQKYDGGLPEGSTDFFAMTVYETFFRRASEKGKKFIINHLLCHCGATTDKHGDTKLYIIPHDVEEFTSNVELFGFDTYSELHRFATAAFKHKPQLELLSDADFEQSATSSTTQKPDTNPVDLTMSTSDEQPDIDTLQQRAEDEADGKRDDEDNERQAEEEANASETSFKSGGRRKHKETAAAA